MKLLLTRIDGDDKQTIGTLYVLNDNDMILADFDTLELPYRDNLKNISCIPLGTYKCRKRYSEKFKNHIILEGVPNREYILIHSGNFYKNTKGCVLIGCDLKDINSDGYMDVVNSRKALDELLYLTDEEISIEIM